MGLFSFIKAVTTEAKKVKKYIRMDYDDLWALSNEELYSAIYARMLDEEGDMDVADCLVHFEGAKRVYYIVNYLDLEVQNGGLCQYFVNSSRETAPYILECLELIDAGKYEKLLREFVDDHEIDLEDLDSFVIGDIKEYQAQTERYPFDEFDDAYYELCEREELTEILGRYIRMHLEEFA